MLMIVSGHCMGQSGYLDSVQGTQWYLAELLGHQQRIAVNVFLILGVWFMVDSQVSGKRILKLHGELWFYCFGITTVILMLGLPVETKNIFRGIFPVLGKALWFLSTYLVLISLSPWLKKILQWNRESLKKLLILLTIFISCWITIYEFDRVEDQWLDCLTWFLYVYLVVGYCKLYVKIKYNKWLLLGIAVAIYAILMLIYLDNINGTGLQKKIAITAIRIVGDYKSLPNFICSLCIFYAFKNFKLGKNKFINYWSSGALAVYIIHQTPALIPYIWNDMFMCSRWLQIEYSIFCPIFTVIIIYIACVLIDKLRIRYVENHWLKSKLFKFLQNKIDGYYKHI